MKRTIITIQFIFVLQTILIAQQKSATTIDTTITNSTKQMPFNFSLDLKNMHLWRGFQVTPGFMTGASLYYISPSKNFKTGFWGGAGFTGEYKEICYILHYQVNSFYFDVLNSFNFSTYTKPNIFSYDPKTSPHYIDITFGYSLKKIPISAALSTVVQGRDIYKNDRGKTRNRFSHYAELKYTAWKSDDAYLKAFLGGGFSFIDKTHFYGSKPNLVNVGFEYYRNVSVLSYSLPLSATFRLNPEQKSAALEFAAHFF